MNSNAKNTQYSFNPKFPLAFYETLTDSKDEENSSYLKSQPEQGPSSTPLKKNINELLVEEEERVRETFRLSSRSFKKTSYNLSFNDFFNTYGIDRTDVVSPTDTKKYRRLKTFTNDLLKNELSYLPKRKAFQRPKSPYVNVAKSNFHDNDDDFNPYKSYKN
jgi:hypothetical protein